MNRSWVLALSIFLFGFSSTVMAEEAAKKESEEKPAETTQTKSSSAQEILDLQARLQVLKTKIAAKKDAMKKLVEEKQKVREEQRAVQIVNDLKFEHKELQTLIREYEEQRSLLNYRYPERGRTESRTYERIELKSLDEMENEFSLEGKVKKTIVRLRQQYPNKNEKTQNQPPDPKTTSTPSKPQEDTSRTSVTESQILSK